MGVLGIGVAEGKAVMVAVAVGGVVGDATTVAVGVKLGTDV